MVLSKEGMVLTTLVPETMFPTQLSASGHLGQTSGCISLNVRTLAERCVPPMQWCSCPSLRYVICCLVWFGWLRLHYERGARCPFYFALITCFIQELDMCADVVVVEGTSIHLNTHMPRSRHRITPPTHHTSPHPTLISCV